MNAILERAIEIATKAHAGQVRKYTGDPYIGHPLEGVEVLKQWYGSESIDDQIVLSGFALHDTFEDTELIRSQLYALLMTPPYVISDSSLRGITAVRICDLVDELTDVYTHEAYPQLNRAVRKKREAERLGKVSPIAKDMKLVDLMINTPSIVQHDPGFGHTYLKEAEELIHQLRGNATEDIWWLALSRVSDAVGAE